MSIEKFWKLDSPSMCRDFLKQVRHGQPPGKTIEYLETESGRRVSIDEASDEQVMQIANDIAESIGARKP